MNIVKDKKIIIGSLSALILVVAGGLYGFSKYKNRPINTPQAEKNEPVLISGINTKYIKNNNLGYTQEEIAKINKSQTFKDVLVGISFEYPTGFQIHELPITPTNTKNIPGISFEPNTISRLWQISLDNPTYPKEYKKAFMVEINSAQALKMGDQTHTIRFDETARAWIKYPTNLASKVLTLRGILRKAPKENLDVRQPDYYLDLKGTGPHPELGEIEPNGIYIFAKNCNPSIFVNQEVTIIAQPRWGYSETIETSPEVFINLDNNKKRIIYCNKGMLSVYPAFKKSFTHFYLSYSQVQYRVLAYKTYFNKALLLIIPTETSLKGWEELQQWLYFISYIERTLKTNYVQNPEKLKSFSATNELTLKFKYPETTSLQKQPLNKQAIRQTLEQFNIDDNNSNSHVLNWWKLENKNHPSAYIFTVNYVHTFIFRTQVGKHAYSSKMNTWFSQSSAGLPPLFLHPENGSVQISPRIYYFESSFSKNKYAFFVIDSLKTEKGFIIAIPIITNDHYYKEARMLANTIYSSLITNETKLSPTLQTFSYNDSPAMKIEFKYPTKYSMQEFNPQIAPKVAGGDIGAITNFTKLSLKKAWIIENKNAIINSSDHGYVLMVNDIKDFKAFAQNYSIEFDKHQQRWIYNYGSNSSPKVIYPLKNGLFVAARKSSQKSHYILWAQNGDQGIIIILPYAWTDIEGSIIKTFKLWVGLD